MSFFLSFSRELFSHVYSVIFFPRFRHINVSFFQDFFFLTPIFYLDFISSLRKLSFSFHLNWKEYDCAENFLMIMNQMELCLMYNKKEIIRAIVFFKFEKKLKSIFSISNLGFAIWWTLLEFYCVSKVLFVLEPKGYTSLIPIQKAN